MTQHKEIPCQLAQTDAEQKRVRDAVSHSLELLWRFFGCVPAFTQGIFDRAVRLRRPPLVGESGEGPPSSVAGNMAAWGQRAVLSVSGS
jgi:hypothetical protein